MQLKTRSTSPKSPKKGRKVERTKDEINFDEIKAKNPNKKIVGPKFEDASATAQQMTLTAAPPSAANPSAPTAPPAHLGVPNDDGSITIAINNVKTSNGKPLAHSVIEFKVQLDYA